MMYLLSFTHSDSKDLLKLKMYNCHIDIIVIVIS